MNNSAVEFNRVALWRKKNKKTRTCERTPCVVSSALWIIGRFAHSFKRRLCACNEGRSFVPTRCIIGLWFYRLLFGTHLAFIISHLKRARGSIGAWHVTGQPIHFLLARQTYKISRSECSGSRFFWGRGNIAFYSSSDKCLIPTFVLGHVTIETVNSKNGMFSISEIPNVNIVFNTAPENNLNSIYRAKESTQIS